MDWVPLPEPCFFTVVYHLPCIGSHLQPINRSARCKKSVHKFFPCIQSHVWATVRKAEICHDWDPEQSVSRVTSHPWKTSDYPLCMKKFLWVPSVTPKRSWAKTLLVSLQEFSPSLMTVPALHVLTFHLPESLVRFLPLAFQWSGFNKVTCDQMQIPG